MTRKYGESECEICGKIMKHRDAKTVEIRGGYDSFCPKCFEKLQGIIDEQKKLEWKYIALLEELRNDAGRT